MCEVIEYLKQNQSANCTMSLALTLLWLARLTKDDCCQFKQALRGKSTRPRGPGPLTCVGTIVRTMC